ncbi:MAG: Starch-binding associating with outer rane, partial [Mucilaginibacter sp.]|nr:Starch-binding associating with outer rane [Mucilaginibacter sp.]
MKKKIIYLAVLLSMITVACTKNFPKINTNPGSFIAAEPEAVLPGVFLNTINRFEQNN